MSRSAPLPRSLTTMESVCFVLCTCPASGSKKQKWCQRGKEQSQGEGRQPGKQSQRKKPCWRPLVSSRCPHMPRDRGINVNTPLGQNSIVHPAPARHFYKDVFVSATNIKINRSIDLFCGTKHETQVLVHAKQVFYNFTIYVPNPNWQCYFL